MSRAENAIASRIRYLASCHEADNRESAIFDLFHKSVRHRYFFTGTEVLLSGLQDSVAVPKEKGLAALEEAAAYRRERSLVYGAFFLAGATSERRLAAPLLYYPATLHPAGDHGVVLRLSISDPAVNFPVLAEIAGEDDSVLDAVAARLPSPPFTEAALSELLWVFRELLPRVATDALYRYPGLDSERDVRGASREEKALACLPAAAMALVENPRSTRGVLSELARVASADRLSSPLEALFGGATAPASSGRSPSLAAIPAVLSRPQQKVLRSARRNPLTLIVGPPGTGKSYTVTALALEHVARGESVLVACRTEQALDVIESKLEAMLGETTPVLRGGSRDYARKLKEFLTRLLSGQLETDDEKVSHWEKRLRRCKRALVGVERRIERHHGLEVARGELASRRPTLGLFEHFEYRLLEWRLARERPTWQLVEELERREAERVAIASKLLQTARRTRIASLLEKHRAELKRFSAAVRARTSGRQEALFEEMNLGVLLGAFPLWMSSFRDLHRFVPFEREMFDLVVVDEATQSDMASALPALHRGRRAAVTGDPRQLRHVSFLSRDRQRLLGEEAGLDENDRASLDYRDKSLLDLVDDSLASQEQVAFLDEHYRSAPPIIDFSNREFYGSGLRIMTARPDALARRAVHLRAVRGKRDENGVNAVEAEALVTELLGWVEAERNLVREQSHSLGILSPFRDQADHLLALVTARLDLPAIEKHDVLVGTAYSFQGEERDVLFLSLAVDAASHPQALRHVNQPDVFNVAITRARAQQFVFASLAAEECPAGSLLQRYLAEAATDARAAAAEGKSPRDDFLEAVAARLEARGLRVHRAFPAGGMTVDLVVEKDGSAFGIDLVGSGGVFAPAIDLERYRMFRRAGFAIFPLTHSAWLADESGVLDALEAHFRRN